MNDYRCQAHPDVKLAYTLKGGAGYCVKCFQYVQACVPMPIHEAARSRTKQKARKKRRAKAR